MAHFYGKLRGNRGEATRLGTKKSGMVTYCASWKGAIHCCAYVNDKGVDCVMVHKVLWEEQGERVLLYNGPIGKVQKGQTEVFGSREANV